MKSFRVLLSCFMFLMVAGMASGQSLWKDASVGMSPAQVIHAIPDAKAPRNARAKLANGAEDLLRIDQYDYLGSKYSVDFYFVNKKLDTVHVDWVDKSDLMQGVPMYNLAVKDLSRDFGEPTKNTLEQMGLFTTGQAVWEPTGIQIALNYIRINDTTMFTIGYRGRAASSTQPAQSSARPAP